MPNAAKFRNTTTIGDLMRAPDALVSVADLKAAKILGSHQAAQRWVKAGRLPKPIVLPNGQIRWVARGVLRAIGLEADDAEGERS